MHRQPVLVQVEKRRRRVKQNLLPENAIFWLSKAVRPWMKKRNPRAASLCRSGFEVFDASDQLDAPMTKRNAEHSVSGQKNGFEITGNEHPRGWLFQEVGHRRHHIILSGAALPPSALDQGLMDDVVFE
jgi:hypothetical protein